MTVQTVRPAAAAAPTAERLPIAGLLALAMTGFTAIMTETLPAGLLPLIGHGLGVSNAAAGQLVTAYAAGSLVAAIPLTAGTQGFRRRPVLLASIVGFLAFNTVTALSTRYGLTLAARFMAGVAAGLAWGIIAGYARRMVPRPLQGRGLALAMIGTPIALSLGTPAGSLLGGIAGWRSAFLAMSALSVLLIGWVTWAVPDFPGQAAGRRPSVRRVFATPGIRPVLAVVVAWMLAHNVLYTYVAPFAALSGLGGSVDRVLLVFGIAALAGIWIVSRLVDTRLRASVLVSVAAFAGVAVILLVDGTSPSVVVAAVAVWGLTFGGAATLIQTASADAAGEGADVAQAMVTTAWNTAIAGGGLVGGLLLDRVGAAALPAAVLIFLAFAFGAAWHARTHAFPPGPRRARPAE